MTAAQANGKPELTGGPGDFKDLIDAVAQGAVTWTHPPPGDPKISQAFLLGWRVGLATGTVEDIDDRRAQEVPPRPRQQVPPQRGAQRAQLADAVGGTPAGRRAAQAPG
jgi:hypothetical protein